MDASTGCARRLLVGLLTAAFGCQAGGETISADQYPDEYTARYCLQHTECGCDVPLADCEARVEEAIGQAVGAAQRLGLQFDANCAAAVMDRISAIECTTDAVGYAQTFASGPTDPLWGCLGCSVFHGDRPAGAGCRQDEEIGASDCASGLSCLQGVCVDPCRVADANEECWRGVRQCEAAGDSSTLCTYEPTDSRSCGAGLRCVLEIPENADAQTARGFCQAPRDDGERCTQGTECGPRSYCDETCQPMRAPGDTCSFSGQCVSGTCTDDVCAPRRPAICLDEPAPVASDGDGDDDGSSGDSGSDEPLTPSNIEGSFLVAVHWTVDPDLPMQFIVRTEPEADQVRLQFVPLSLHPGETLNPREPLAGSGFILGPAELDEDNTSSFGETQVEFSGEANPISGEPIAASVRATVEFRDADTLCGELAGSFTVPLVLDVTGTTVVGVRLDDEDELPPPPGADLCR